MFADAGSLGDAAKILKNDYLSKDRLWASWGDYDRRQFERVCKDQDVGYPFGPSHLKREGTLDPMQTLQWKRGSVFEVLSANLSSRSVSGDGNPNNPGGASCETRTTKTSTNSHFFETMSKRRKAPKRINVPLGCWDVGVSFRCRQLKNGDGSKATMRACPHRAMIITRRKL